MKMTKPRSLVLAGLGLLAVMATGLVIVSPREPQHLGRPVSAWLDQYNSSREDDRKAADEAFRAMGSQAVPTLVTLLKARDSKLKAGLARVAWKLPVARYSYVPPGQRQLAIVQALDVLRKEGSPAVPVLVDLLDRPDRALLAVNGLMAVGVEDKTVYEGALLSPDPLVRRTAAGALSRLAEGKSMRAFLGTYGEMRGTNAFQPTRVVFSSPGVSPYAVVPLLVNRMTDRDPQVRSAAIVALGDYAKMYPSKVRPAVGAALSDPDAGVRRAATNTFARLPRDD